MRWERARQSGNVEDRRRAGAGRRVATIGAGGVLLVVVLALVTGQDPGELLVAVTGPGASVPGGGAGEEPGFGGGVAGPEGLPGQADAQRQFVAAVLGDTEDTWDRLFAGSGLAYEPPRLVLFSDAVDSACGYSSAAVGPFYCPADRQVYIDLTFFEELDRRFGAPGDFARAYVIAHEVGHHVQALIGVSGRVDRLQRAAREAERNALSVRQELQADCFAGIWAHHADRARGLLEPGDLEEGLGAAAAIGDDTLQRRSGGRVQPESWTHGSSGQRVAWFRRGFEAGRVEACDTFAAGAP